MNCPKCGQFMERDLTRDRMGRVELVGYNCWDCEEYVEVDPETIYDDAIELNVPWEMDDD